VRIAFDKELVPRRAFCCGISAATSCAASPATTTLSHHLSAVIFQKGDPAENVAVIRVQGEDLQARSTKAAVLNSFFFFFSSNRGRLSARRALLDGERARGPRRRVEETILIGSRGRAYSLLEEQLRGIGHHVLCTSLRQTREISRTRGCRGAPSSWRDSL